MVKKTSFTHVHNLLLVIAAERREDWHVPHDVHAPCDLAHSCNLNQRVSDDPTHESRVIRRDQRCGRVHHAHLQLVE